MRCSPPPHEVIVVDGGSSDATAGVGCRMARVLHAERGRARQQNAGALVADGAVLWFLHADSIPPPDAIGQIRSEVADLTIEATERVVGKVLDAEDHRRLVREAVEGLDFSALENRGN